MKLKYEVVDPQLTVEQDLAPIVFLHGMAETKKTWKHVAPVIARKTLREAFVLDARNHGESPRSPEMDYEVMTQDLLEFLNSQSIKKAVLIGHSMGGRVAITLALKHPERVDLLIVEDMTPRDVYLGKNAPVLVSIETFKEISKNLPSDFDLNELKTSLLDLSMFDVPEEYRDKYQKMYDLDQMPVKKVGEKLELDFDFEAIISMVKNNSLVQNLSEKCQPFHGNALFIYGNRPNFKLYKEPSIPKLFPKAVLRKIESSYTHFSHLDSPDEFIDTVSEFILHRKFNRSKY